MLADRVGGVDRQLVRYAVQRQEIVIDGESLVVEELPERFAGLLTDQIRQLRRR
jgi:hypothetical protein